MAEGGGLFRELLPSVILAVMGVVVLIVGTVVGSVTSGIGYYIISVFNSAGVTIPSSSMYINSINGIVGTVFTLIGIALLVAAAVLAIVFLLRMITEMRGATSV